MAELPNLRPEPRPQLATTVSDPEGQVRVRFAPSPSGPLHVGNALTALFNWLFARGHDGQFILRIEDTDAARSALEYEQAIMQDLAWLGLEWDEGPDRGGPAGPYRQSDRLAIYRAQAETLIGDGIAYPCFCAAERLSAEQELARRNHQPYRYSGACRAIEPAAAARRRAAGEPCTIRFCTPVGPIAVHDRLRGTLTFDGADFGDLILLKSDGVAAYNFAVVVDDALMGITHVIRGDDHLANTPKQILLFDALGFPRPDYLHLPPVVGSDGRPLAKREGGASLAALRGAGILPGALNQYLATLGWAQTDSDIPVELERLAADFTTAKLSHRPAHHDEERLHHFQRLHLRRLPTDLLAHLCIPFLQRAGFVATPPSPAEQERVTAIVVALHDEIHHLPDLPEQIAYLFRPPAAEAIARRLAPAPDAATALEVLATRLAAAPVVDTEAATATIRAAATASGLTGRAFFLPVRLALTGRDHGPDLATLLMLLGTTEARARLLAIRHHLPR